MPRYINKPNVTINKFYGVNHQNKNDRRLFNNHNQEDLHDFHEDLDFYDFENLHEQEDFNKHYTNPEMFAPKPSASTNKVIHHYHTHEVIFNNKEENSQDDSDFFDDNEYVLEELPEFEQPKKKFVLKRYNNSYNR